MDLETAIQETQCALNLVLNNKFSQALDLLKPWYSIDHILSGTLTHCFRSCSKVKRFWQVTGEEMNKILSVKLNKNPFRPFRFPPLIRSWVNKVN